MELISSGMNEKVAQSEQAENSLTKNNTHQNVIQKYFCDSVLDIQQKKMLNYLIIKLIILLQGIILFFQ